jgi:hypothetical protein
MLGPALDAVELTRRRAAFLASAEASGRDALDSDLAPDDVAARIADPSVAVPEPTADPATCPSGGSLWWSDGSELVVPTTIGCLSLPDEAGFARMLDDAAPAAIAGCGERS